MEILDLTVLSQSKFIGIIFMFLLGAIVSLRFTIRVELVARFLTMLNNMAYNYAMRHIGEISVDRSKDPYSWFIDNKCPSFERLLFSTRPLVLSEWFDAETIEKIKS